MEAIDLDGLSHEKFKQNIVSVFGDELVYILGKLNIDLNNFDDVDDMHSQILNFCEKKYNNKDQKLDSLKESKKDKKVIANLRNRSINKLASLKAIRISREKAEKFIENYRLELLPLLPLIASALTFLDPLKRSNLYKYLPEWKSLSKETDATIPNFLLWLETKNIALNEYKNTSSFSTDKALVKFIDYVAYNSFWIEGSIPLEGTFIYVISPDRSLYVAPENAENESVFIKDLPNTHLYHHSDISVEPWAISAGQMVFKDGKIIYVNRQSGHYKPHIKHLKYGIKSLKQKFGKSVFSKEYLIDASLATNIEFNPQKKLLTFSRFLDGPFLSPSEELGNDELSLFDLGFKD